MKRYCFVDMHMHSIFSNEEGVRQTPGQILNNIYNIVQDERQKENDKIINLISQLPLKEVHKNLAKYFGLESQAEYDLLWECLQGNDLLAICDNVTKHFVKACISITDHNSILGSTEAVRIIRQYPEKYSCIDFVPGIEFNAGLKELGLNESGKSIYSKCHVLGYGYDIEDKGLRVFSELFQLTIGRSNINVGQSVCAGRNLLEQKYGVKIPLAELEPILEYGKQYEHSPNRVDGPWQTMRDMFLEICKNYVPENKFEDFKSQLREAFPQYASMVPYNAGKGKLNISEVAELIDDAGGKMSIAHPRYINYNKKVCQTPEHIREMLEDFIPRVQAKTGNKLYALEAFHPDCSDYLETILDVAHKYGLYVTCGSDNHGPNLHVENKISRCFGKGYEFNSVVAPISWPEQIKNRIIYISVLDILLDKPIKNFDRQLTAVKRVDGSTYGKKEIIRISNRSYRSLQEKREQERLGRQNQHQAQQSQSKPQQQHQGQHHMSKRDRKKARKQMQNELQRQNNPYAYQVPPPAPQRESNLIGYKKQWKPEYEQNGQQQTENDTKKPTNPSTGDGGSEIV